jgi:hypothetical protein
MESPELLSNHSARFSGALEEMGGPTVQTEPEHQDPAGNAVGLSERQPQSRREHERQEEEHQHRHSEINTILFSG